VPHAAYRPTFVKSMVMTPVRRDDPIAAIGAYWRRRRRPTANELRTLRWIANSAAVALTNVALYESFKSAKDEAIRAREATVLAMASLAATRDNETANHVRRTQQFIKILAEAALAKGLYAPQLDTEQVDLMVKSAPLHDIGKIGIPDKILQKPGKLDPDEFEVMKTHAEMGRAALEAAEKHLGVCTPFFQTAQEIAYTHHERWDGSGYPRGIKGADIPLSGRFMALVDVYDALVSERVYKKGMPHADAIAIIAGESGRHFDPQLVRIFLEVEQEFAEVSRFMSDDPAVSPPQAAVAS
jgi:response regulator RpfG family c-di-GMP phosphodiesterase